MGLSLCQRRGTDPSFCIPDGLSCRTTADLPRERKDCAANCKASHETARLPRSERYFSEITKAAPMSKMRNTL